MAHDLLAELQGYRNELAIIGAQGDSERADAIRGEIQRVTDAVTGRITELQEAAAGHAGGGQDVLAGRALEEAARLISALSAHTPAAAAGNASQPSPPNKTVTRKPPAAKAKD
ncbi:hypothetical protein ACFWYW_14590 [Nonomuraea sp. NPDC059023]|uniref:hypothetical protein n=1 Tax=unclassified Nonomuraea TaxID=2593643 RepID=UPI0036ABCAB2